MASIMALPVSTSSSKSTRRTGDGRRENGARDQRHMHESGKRRAIGDAGRLDGPP